MNGVAILLVPVGATRRDFEGALRECAGQIEFVEVPRRTGAQPITFPDAEAMPLWMWFIASEKTGRA